MNSLFDVQTSQEITQRIENLKVDSPRQWGKMDVAQMLAHCAFSMETAIGDKNPSRTFLGKLLGRFMQGELTNSKPMGKNLPTHPQYIMVELKDFEREKIRLISSIKRFLEGGESKVTKKPHPFFGDITPVQWSCGSWKHLDHHLRQFKA
ncbi:MAG: DUF1569 domain-containing protein [Arcicella sp.]|nr:DUF1569 domain-containing protein [Arcicella sp.]